MRSLNGPTRPTGIDADEIIGVENEETEMLSATSRFGALAVVAWLMLAMIVAACGTQSPAGDDSRVDWSSFTTMEGPGLRSSTLDDLSREGGFRFVLPSYLPPGMSHTFFLSTQIESSSHDQGVVTLRPDGETAPGMQINESLLPPGRPAVTGYGQDYDVHTIAGINVGCLPETPDEGLLTPAPGESQFAGLQCQWDDGGLFFRVEFSWRFENGATPEVAPERRAEAIKVVTSMIEHPYTP